MSQLAMFYNIPRYNKNNMYAPLLYNIGTGSSNLINSTTMTTTTEGKMAICFYIAIDTGIASYVFILNA